MALLEWNVRRRKLLKPEDREALPGIPYDETSMMLHYTLTLADRLEVKLVRRIQRGGVTVASALLWYVWAK